MAEQIARERLVVGRHYVGRGRNGNVGLWDGESFLVVGQKGQFRVVKLEGYYGLEDGCFQPFREIDEGRVAESLGSVGWEAHYARVLEFDDKLPTPEGQRHAAPGTSS